MDLRLAGQVALVTAASRGLGKAAALGMAREGAQLSICARSDQIDSAAADIENQTKAQVLPIRADLTIIGDIERLVEATLERFGKIDILFINSGGPPPGSFMSLNSEDWEAAVQLTLMSAVRLCYAVLPHMLDRGSGCIITTQSYSVKQPIDNLILSNSLRMAVIGLMKSLANELGPQGIRVNSINPAWTWTDRVAQLMADRAAANDSTVEEEAAKVAQVLPLGRMGTLEEYGKAVAWLASPAAGFIHGHALMFDGGGTAAPL